MRCDISLLILLRRSKENSSIIIGEQGRATKAKIFWEKKKLGNSGLSQEFLYYVPWAFPCCYKVFHVKLSYLRKRVETGRIKKVFEKGLNLGNSTLFFSIKYGHYQIEHHVPRSFYLIFVRKKVLIATSKVGNYIEMLDGRKLASDFSSQALFILLTYHNSATNIRFTKYYG